MRITRRRGLGSLRPTIPIHIATYIILDLRLHAPKLHIIAATIVKLYRYRPHVSIVCD